MYCNGKVIGDAFPQSCFSATHAFGLTRHDNIDVYCKDSWLRANLPRESHQAIRQGERIFVVPLRWPVLLGAVWLLHHMARQPLARPMRLPRLDHRTVPSFKI